MDWSVKVPKRESPESVEFCNVVIVIADNATPFAVVKLLPVIWRLLKNVKDPGRPVLMLTVVDTDTAASITKLTAGWKRTLEALVLKVVLAMLRVIPDPSHPEHPGRKKIVFAPVGDVHPKKTAVENVVGASQETVPLTMSKLVPLYWNELPMFLTMISGAKLVFAFVSIKFPTAKVATTLEACGKKVPVVNVIPSGKKTVDPDAITKLTEITLDPVTFKFPNLMVLVHVQSELITPPPLISCVPVVDVDSMLPPLDTAVPKTVMDVPVSVSLNPPLERTMN